MTKNEVFEYVNDTVLSRSATVFTMVVDTAKGREDGVECSLVRGPIEKDRLGKDFPEGDYEMKYIPDIFRKALYLKQGTVTYIVVIKY